jgi:hypothetical protein
MNLVHKIANRLPGWKMILLSYPRRELLVKTVLSVVPTFFLTAFKLPKWGATKINRFHRSFLWKGQDLKMSKEAIVLLIGKSTPSLES